MKNPYSSDNSYLHAFQGKKEDFEIVLEKIAKLESPIVAWYGEGYNSMHFYYQNGKHKKCDAHTADMLKNLINALILLYKIS